MGTPVCTTSRADRSSPSRAAGYPACKSCCARRVAQAIELGAIAADAGDAWLEELAARDARGEFYWAAIVRWTVRHTMRIGRQHRDSLERIRRYAVARSLFGPTTLEEALESLGFVQADPIRAPARAQDLTLRHRVAGYRAGDLERRYATLDVHEDVFVNYGFVTGAVQALMHPRGGHDSLGRRPADRRVQRAARVRARARRRPPARSGCALLARDRDQLLGRLVQRDHASARRACTTGAGCAWCGARQGIRIYAAHEHATAPIDAAARRARLDALVDVIVRKYAPLPVAEPVVARATPSLRRAAMAEAS